MNATLLVHVFERGRLTNLLDLSLKLWVDDTLRDLLEKSTLCTGEMSTEFQLPLGNLINRNRVKLREFAQHLIIRCDDKHAPDH
jgi:hypothetical protein